MTPADISRAKGASDVFEFTYDNADVAQTFVFDKNDWGLSLGAGVNVTDAVRPATDPTGPIFREDWSSGVIDPAKWQTFGSTQCSIVGNRLAFSTGATTSDYARIEGIQTLDLTNSSVSFSIDDTNLTSGSHEAHFNVGHLGVGDFATVLVIPGGLIARSYVGFSATATFIEAPMTPGKHFYRIRHAGGQNIAWDYSPDGVAWTQFDMKPVTWDITAVNLGLMVGHWQNETGPVTVYYDDIVFNTPGADVSLAGTWTASVTLFHLDVFSSAHVTWEGTNLTMEYTLNGTTWLPLTINTAVNLAGDPDFDIRATFAGGVLNDPAELVSVTIQVLKTDTIRSTGSRSGTFTADAMTDEGLVVRGGSLIVPASTLTPAPTVGTVEIWARSDTNADTDYASLFEYSPYSGNGWIGWYHISTFSPDNVWQVGDAAVYVDGVLKPLPLVGGTQSADFILSPGWHHFVVVSATAVNLPFGVGNNVSGTSPTDITVGHLALYPQRMTASDAAALYAAQSPVPVRIDDTSAISVTQAADSLDIYAFSWSVISS
jgi:hypothetical protein